jgi:hypothetical protein
VARLRLGNFGTELRTPYGYSYTFSDCTLQAGGGMRFTDFVNLGQLLEPYVGLHTSAGYLLSSPKKFQYDTRWLVAAGAEAGVHVWLNSTSSVSVGFELHHSLTRLYTPTQYTVTKTTPVLTFYDVQASFKHGYGSLMIGWTWQLHKPTPRPRWHTPRYSESFTPEA